MEFDTTKKDHEVLNVPVDLSGLVLVAGETLSSATLITLIDIDDGRGCSDFAVSMSISALTGTLSLGSGGITGHEYVASLTIATSASQTIDLNVNINII